MPHPGTEPVELVMHLQSLFKYKAFHPPWN